MRKIIGIGETIMDIIFKNGQPTAAVPGGSVFNGAITLGRLGQNVAMISETGNDRVGRMTLDFMAENGVDNSGVCVYHDGRTAISLAWLNENNDAEYSFYKDYPKARLDVEWPVINPDDIVMMSSYFVLNPALRPKVKEFLDYARKSGAIIYYDVNFRSSHRDEAIKLYADILENFEYADIVRGSTEDFDNMFGSSDPAYIYSKEISFHCKNLICTDAGSDIRLFTPSFTESYEVSKIETVSTIGAGDNFNAGVIYGIMKEGILREDILSMTKEQWSRIIGHASALSAHVCQSFNNYISVEFAKEYMKK
jgi:fructokinase